LAYPAKGHPRRNFYSNPEVIYPNTSTPTGVTGEANNAAYMTARRFVIGECDTYESEDLCTKKSEDE